MRERSRVYKEYVRAEFRRQVTANPAKRGKERLRQAGDVYRGFEGRAHEALYQFIAHVFELVTGYARSKRAYEKLTKDAYFTDSSRKRPAYRSRYSQIMCFVLQAQGRVAREKAQRLGRIIQMLDQQGKRGPAVIGAIRDLGGVAKAHKAAKRYLAPFRLTTETGEDAGVAQRSPHRMNEVEGAERQEDKEVKLEEAEPDAQCSRAARPPALSRVPKSEQKRNYRYLEVTATEKQKARVLRLERDPERVRLTCRVEGDPTAEDGWRIITVERVEMLD